MLCFHIILYVVLFFFSIFFVLYIHVHIYVCNVFASFLDFPRNYYVYSIKMISYISVKIVIISWNIIMNAAISGLYGLSCKVECVLLGLFELVTLAYRCYYLLNILFLQNLFDTLVENQPNSIADNIFFFLFRKRNNLVVSISRKPVPLWSSSYIAREISLLIWLYISLYYTVVSIKIGTYPFHFPSTSSPLPFQCPSTSSPLSLHCPSTFYR